MKHAILSIAVLWVFAGSGCETGYRSGRQSVSGGYESQRKRFNVFHVWYKGNAFVTEEKASDFVRMRAAELTLEHGFEYLAVLAWRNDTGYDGRPLAQLAIVCFRNDPKHARAVCDVHDGEQLFKEITAKHAIRRRGEPIQPTRGAFESDPNAIEFEIEPWYANDPITVEEVDHVVRNSGSFDLDGTWVGSYRDFENPAATIDAFVEMATPLAVKHGANALVLETNPTRIHQNPRLTEEEENKLIGFSAELYVVPQASPGIEWEPGDLLLGKYMIRRFRAGSKCAEAGLRLGDKVLTIDGVDVLNTNALLQRSMQWSVGDTIKLSAVREGRETVFDVSLVPNMIVQ